MSKKLKRFLPIIAIGVGMVLAYFLGLYDAISFDMIREKHKELQAFVESKPVIAPILFMIVYTVSTAFSIPGGIFLTLLGGYLFPLPWSFFYVLIAATCGACIVFLAAKTAIGDYFRNKAGPFLQKMEAGFRENAVSYLFFLRLAPIFPFWLVNVAPAFFGIPLRTYAWTTFLGIAPGTFVFCQAGAGIESVLNTEGEFSINSFFTTKIKVALILLALFALIPPVIKKIRSKNSKK